MEEAGPDPWRRAGGEEVGAGRQRRRGAPLFHLFSRDLDLDLEEGFMKKKKNKIKNRTGNRRVTERERRSSGPEKSRARIVHARELHACNPAFGRQ